MRRFLRPPSLPTVRPPPDPITRTVPFDHRPMHRKKCLFGHVFKPPPRAYDSFRLQPLDPLPLPFQSDSLNLAVACLRTYLRLRDTTEWYHVMVRTFAYSAFVQALDDPHVRTLPYSCWCDGGKPTVASHRQHRHFIVVCHQPGGHFQRWLKTIVPEHRPKQNFRCLVSKRIVSPRHLVNTLGYVCKRESYCMFTKEDTKRPKQKNHFYLFEELPKGYRLPLALQWEGGLNQLIHQQHRHFKRLELVQAPVFLHEGRFRIQIRDIPGIELGTVLPVAKDFEPCPTETEAFVHLIGQRKLYFKWNPELADLDTEAWHQKQAAAGNAFYHTVGDEPWTPRPYHQAFLHEFWPLVDEKRDLEARLAQQEHACQTLEQRTRELEGRLSLQEREARTQQQALQLELRHAQQQYQDLETHFRITRETLEEERRKAREALELELEATKKKYEASERENKRLREEERDRLRSELLQTKKRKYTS